MKVVTLSLGLLAIAGLSYWGGQENPADTMSELALENVEALANTEQTPCENGRHCTQMENRQCWYYLINVDGNMFVGCFDNQVHQGQD